MDFQELRRQLPDIFERVKRDVEDETGHHRAGLALGLVEMGMFRGGFIGGMFFSGGTMILMNRTPLRIIMAEQPDEVVWAYNYHILLHEYLHSLGFMDERQVRALTIGISRSVFEDPGHPSVVLAERGIGAFFTNLPLIYAPPGFSPKGLHIDVVKDFDKGSQTYFS
ncbi:MAG: hypothetical protein ACFFBS_05935 [Promethearchaeota archaeon]